MNDHDPAPPPRPDLAATRLPGVGHRLDLREWTITVIVQPDRFTETRATVRVTLR